MFRIIAVGRYFREAFGETTTPFELLVTLSFGIGLATILIVLYPDAFGNVALWWDGVALLLIFDVGSGCSPTFRTQPTHSMPNARVAAGG